MAKRKAVKTYEQENENTALVQQPAQIRQENLERDLAVDDDNIRGGQTVSQAILGLGQSYGNRYVRNLIGDMGKVAPQTQSKIESQRGSGQPLDEGLRVEMEQSYNRGLGEVRIHTGNEAARLANELNAWAFTTGNDIFFGDDAFQPGTEQGRKTLRHELAHVAQQMEDMAVMPSVLTQPGDKVEQDAAAAENSDTWTPARALPAGAIARINPPTSTPEAPNAASAPSSAPAASSSPQSTQNPTGDDAIRRQALQGMWQGMVVGPVTSAQGIITGDIDAAKASQARDLISTSLNGIASILPSYVNRPDFYTALQRDYNGLQGIKLGLATFAGAEVSPASMVNGLAMEGGRLAAMAAEL
jgi:hypothetical protein